MRQIKIFLLISSVILFTACGGGGSEPLTDTTITTQTIAIDKIKSYADDDTQPVPTIEDYVNAGVTGVTLENIDDVNEVVASLKSNDVDTIEEIQQIIEDLSINILPTADAGLDMSIELNQAIVITGTATDADGSIASIEWADSEGNVLSTTLSFTYIGTTLGTHSLTLTVADDEGATSTDTVNITVNILHNGIAYGTITSPVTGKIWLDRNLGADRVCTSFDDVQCYGDYYQWGRETDGHEKKDSLITETQSPSVIVGHEDFISRPTVSSWSSSSDFIGMLVTFSDGTEMTITDNDFTPVAQYVDWTSGDIDGIIRSTDWNPCPAGYRVPTINELNAENISLSTYAFDNLKLGAGGYRQTDGSFISSGTDILGYYWSSNYGEYKFIWPPNSSSTTPPTLVEEDLVKGMHVRCIQEY